MKAEITQQVKPENGTDVNYNVTIADTTLSHLKAKSLWKQAKETCRKINRKMVSIK